MAAAAADAERPGSGATATRPVDSVFFTTWFTTCVEGVAAALVQSTLVPLVAPGVTSVAMPVPAVPLVVSRVPATVAAPAVPTPAALAAPAVTTVVPKAEAPVAPVALLVPMAPVALVALVAPVAPMTPVAEPMVVAAGMETFFGGSGFTLPAMIIVEIASWLTWKYVFWHTRPWISHPPSCVKFVKSQMFTKASSQFLFSSGPIGLSVSLGPRSTLSRYGATKAVNVG
mmetsp:Transcript_137397/g.342701  ORF Transcript_137397/g.342701 Transcript_137397/m.342701 type:complete len:229 (-) Transcript_137397:1476-2162(-)